MNKVEEFAKKKYESDGWEVVRGGAPDFLLIKRDGKYHFEITDVKFVEVKTKSSKTGHTYPLSQSQKIYRKILQDIIGADYELLEIPDNLKIGESIKCSICGQDIEYCGSGRKPKYCKSCATEKHKKQKKHRMNKKRNLGTTNIGKFDYKDFWDDFDKIQKEKAKSGLTPRTCPNCGSYKIKFDRVSYDVYCDDCGLVIDRISKIKAINYDWNPFPDQNDWNR